MLLRFLGSVLLFVAASCLVAELLHWTLGDADSLFSLRDLWRSLDSATLSGLEGRLSGLLGGLLWTAIAWVLALPSWLALLAVGGPLVLAGSGGRERTFG